jgi:hypothetical protein
VNNQGGHPNVQTTPNRICENNLEVILVNSGIIGEIVDPIDDKSINEPKDAWIKGCRLDSPTLVNRNKQTSEDPHHDPTPYTENKFFLNVVKQWFVDRRNGHHKPQHVKNNKEDETDQPHQDKFFYFHFLFVVFFLMRI